MNELARRIRAAIIAGPTPQHAADEVDQILEEALTVQYGVRDVGETDPRFVRAHNSKGSAHYRAGTEDGEAVSRAVLDWESIDEETPA